MVAAVGHVSVEQSIADGIGELSIADRICRVFHHLNNTVVTFTGMPDRPDHGNPGTNSLIPVRTNLGEIVRPNIGGAARVLPMDNHNITARQRDIRIGFSKLGVVSFGDRSEINAGQRLGGEVELVDDSGQVIDRNVSTDRCREVEHLAIPMGAEIQHLRFVQWTIGAAKSTVPIMMS